MSLTLVDPLVDAFQEAWVGRRRAAFAECCAPDVHYEDPLCVEPLNGIDELADHAAQPTSSRRRASTGSSLV